MQQDKNKNADMSLFNTFNIDEKKKRKNREKEQKKDSLCHIT